MCRLQDEGRNHVWSFYVRNLARPVWLSHPENRVERLVGNPPWLAYRFMTVEMQAAFRRMSERRGLRAGATVATHQDLSGLFLVRAVEQYLRPGGRFAFVMPLATLSRRQYAGLRTGDFLTDSSEVRVAYDTPRDLHRVKPNLFRVPPSVVSGGLSDSPMAMPADAEQWAGTLPGRNISWDLAAPCLTRTPAGVAVARDEPHSPYHARFMQGATLVPRFLLMVEDAPASPLGIASGRRAVRSLRTNNEKQPWKDLPGLEGSVEEQFVRPVYLGSSLLPFRLLNPWLGVVPWDGERLLERADPQLALYPGLAEWWTRAEDVWDEHNGGNNLKLLEQVDYRRKLTEQFPAPQLRIVYSKSGQYLTAACLEDDFAVVDHKLYWGTAASLEEARYLTAILNSPALTALLAPRQSRGEHNPRDFDKLVWTLPVPLFDPADAVHAQLVDLAARAELIAAEADVSAHRTFQAQRRVIREALAARGISKEIDALVLELLGETAASGSPGIESTE